jgi:D-alanyl-D-alanine carboxypeptidase
MNQARRVLGLIGCGLAAGGLTVVLVLGNLGADRPARPAEPASSDTLALDGAAGGAATAIPDDADGQAGGWQLDQSGAGGDAGQGLPEPGDWALVLVNRTHPVPSGYQVELLELDNGERVDARIYPALQAMFDAARADGVYPVVTSGYRTAAQQQELFDRKAAEFVDQGLSPGEAEDAALTWVAAPGTSEHQLGLSVDVNADGVYSDGDQVYDWLDAHAPDYGFIRRYPPDKTAITGVSNEPWHYRYVGPAAAAEMRDQGLSLEEYVEHGG